MQARIIVIEDQEKLGQTITDILIKNGYQAWLETSGSEGLDLAKQIKPDLVILDRSLPDLTGLSVCQQLKALLPRCVVIMLTGMDSTQEIVQGLQAGADDYISKPADPAELLARIKIRLSAAQTKDPILKVGDLSLNTSTHLVKRGAKLIDLTPQEFKLLEFLMQHREQVVSRDMILSRLWETKPGVETRIVDVYIGYLRKKVDFIQPKLIESVRGFGYKITASN